MGSSSVVMAGRYDYRLVPLSALVAFSSAYAALDLARRVIVARGWGCAGWWSGGTVVMGIGIWAMHFTGMLAYHLPVLVAYDWPTTLASFLIATAASGIAWYIVIRQNAGWAGIFIGGAVQGCGIAGLHYTAMAAMLYRGVHRYNPGIVILSVILAIAYSNAGLWLAFKYRNPAGVAGWSKILGALLLGAGISAMHYTAMAGTTFLASTEPPDLSHAVSITTLGAMGIGVVAVLVQLLAILTSFVGSRFQVQAQQLRFAQEFSAGLFRLQDKERRRLARQLHATVAQSLAALKMNLTKLSRSVAEDASILAESVALTDEATKEVRTLSYELHPPLLEEAGLVQSLRWYAKGFAERSGTSVQLDVSPELEQMRMPEGIETTAFRIVQECLSNVHHHSGSATARITVDLEGGNLCVAVEDEGHGMPAERAGGFAGVGLAALRERVKRLGGQLEIHSSSHGTKVSVMVSIERAKLWRNSAS